MNRYRVLTPIRILLAIRFQPSPDARSARTVAKSTTVLGRPSRLPLARAFRKPARTRSAIKLRSNSARARLLHVATHGFFESDQKDVGQRVTIDQKAAVRIGFVLNKFGNVCEIRNSHFCMGESQLSTLATPRLCIAGDAGSSKSKARSSFT